ncbi:hypothetical protein P4S83_18405 [Aneurinibacillus thermoaerophilus]|uniref:hypothetical protein n=1 Tax=Aneurinibacillus thermoaerophilus TaxID=143495 RepID=UPI002E22498D|nr:hypothetical protein [Aneurinibacillus thermoaerophilus]MED0766317.1 hypothetical protein [Aneurinibacillus thermoaerophilus]
MKTKVAGYGNIQLVSPYEVKNLSEIKIVKTVNNHATLYVKGMIPEDKRDCYIEMATSTDTVEVNQIENGSVIRTLFDGLVSNIGITTVRGIYYLEVEALSHTCRMDVKLKNRSFQNKDMLYTSLIDRVIADYPESDFIDMASKSSKLGKCVIQYNETDWQFLKRMASHFGAVLIPEATAKSPKFWFGLTEGKPGKLLERHYSVKKILSDYREATENGGGELGEEDFVCYTVETDHYFNIGDTITFKGEEWKVARSIATVQNGILKYEYTLAPEKGIRQNFIVNSQLSGASLEGKVIDVAKDTVRIHLDIDQEQKKDEAYWFPYATFYTAEGNSGWYCMPQLEDKVQLYVPSSREEEAVAIRSVRKGGKNNPKTADPNVKYWGTNHDKEIKMDGKALVLTAKADKEGTIHLKLHEEEGIEFYSDKPIVCMSDKDIQIHACKRLDIKAREAIYFLCGSSSIVMDGVTDIKGSSMKMEGLVKKPVFMPNAAEKQTTPRKKESEFLDQVQLAVSVTGMLPFAGDGARAANSGLTALGTTLSACVPFAGMTGRSEKKVINGVIGKVFTGARKIKSNLTQGEVFKKLKGKIKAEVMAKKSAIKKEKTKRTTYAYKKGNVSKDSQSPNETVKVEVVAAKRGRVASAYSGSTIGWRPDMDRKWLEEMGKEDGKRLKETWDKTPEPYKKFTIDLLQKYIETRFKIKKPQQTLKINNKPQGTNNAYDIAKSGGKHSGFYKQYINKSPEQIRKAINSINKQIAEHQDKIKNPEKYIPNFRNLDPRQQQALIHKKWPSDIKRQMEQKQILEGILKSK